MLNKFAVTAVTGLATALLMSTTSVMAKTPPRQCSGNDWQACRTCPEIEKAIDWTQPDAGDYYRGAYWNALYVSYISNCQATGKKLIAAGANPNLGGSYGSMVITVSIRDSKKKIQTNRQWIDILKGADVDAKIAHAGGTSAREKYIENIAIADFVHPEIWAHFLNKKP